MRKVISFLFERTIYLNPEHREKCRLVQKVCFVAHDEVMGDSVFSKKIPPLSMISCTLNGMNTARLSVVSILNDCTADRKGRTVFSPSVC